VVANRATGVNENKDRSFLFPFPFSYAVFHHRPQSKRLDFSVAYFIKSIHAVKSLSKDLARSF
jgi:hypothetical protein